MKKKSALLLVLAMASAATLGLTACGDDHEWQSKSDANGHWQECSDCGLMKDYAAHVDAGHDGKCDTCDADVHVHSFTMKSDDDSHWQECTYGEKVNVGGHVDVINNETGDEGMDGKCDTCDAVTKVAVTFNMLGHGTAPDTQRVTYGGKATLPTAPTEQGWVFGGWYTDSGLGTEFKFDETAITAATTVYAKWTVDTTPGVSTQYPKALTYESEAEATAFGTNTKLYFTFTATATGRYALRLQNGTASQACTYTTDIDGDDATHDKTADYNFDLRAGKTVMIEVTRGENVANDSKVGVYVTAVTDEALPATGWVSGEYTDGTNTLVFDRAAKTMKFNSFDPVSLSYVGGIVDEATFTITSQAGSGKFTVTEKNGVLQVKCNNASILDSTEGAVDFERVVPFEPIPVAKFSGVYEKESGGLSNGRLGTVATIGIYEDGTGYFLNAAKSDRLAFEGTSAQYDTEKNILSYSTYKITVHLDEDDNVTSISVTNGNATVEYARTGDVGDKVPATFEGLENNATYAGAYASFVFAGVNTQLGGRLMTIIDYKASTKTYTVAAGGEKYIVTITGEGDAVSIAVKDEEGEPLDTLTKFNQDAHVLSTASEAATVTAQTSDIKMGLYHLKVETEGWYVFNTAQEGLAFYKMNDNTVDYFNVNDPDSVKEITAGETVLLKEGEHIAVSVEDYEGTYPVTFTTAKTESPLGYGVDRPVTKDGVGTYELGTKMGGYDYYVKFPTLPEGDYIVTVSYESEGTHSGMSYALFYKLNGDEGHGMGSGWTDDFVYGRVHSVKKTVQGSDGLLIAIEKSTDVENLIVKVEKDYTKFEYDNDFNEVPTNPFVIDDIGTYDLTVFGTKDPDEGMYGMAQYSFVTVEAPQEYGLLLSFDVWNNNSEIDDSKKQYIMDADYTMFGYKYDDGEDKYITALGGLKYAIAAGATATVKISNNYYGFMGGTATLIVERNYTADAEKLTFTKIQMGSSIIKFKISSAGTSQNFELGDTKGADIYVSANGAFTIHYPDGTDVPATEENGSYLVTIPATTGMCFNITAAESVNVFFATSYGVGSQGNPKNAKFNGVTFSDTLGKGETVYYNLPVGSYSYSSNAARFGLATVYLNGEEFYGDTFDIKDGDVLSFAVADVAEEDVTFTVIAYVPKALRGNYTYTQGSETKDLSIDTDSVTVDGKTYTLSAINGDVYTFTNVTGDDETSITITAGDDGLLLNDNIALEEKVTVVPANLVGTWTGSVMGNVFTLVINPDFTAKYTEMYSPNPHSVTIASNGSGYTFTYDDAYTVTFTVNGDTMTLIDGSTVTLTKTIGLVGTWSADGMANQTVLTIKDDYTADYTDWMGYPDGTVEITYSNGVYHFSYEYKDNVTFTLNDDGTMTLKDGSSATLTKQA